MKKKRTKKAMRNAMNKARRAKKKKRWKQMEDVKDTSLKENPKKLEELGKEAHKGLEGIPEIR